MPPKFLRPDDPVLRKYLDAKNIDTVIFDLYKQVCKDRPEDVLDYLIRKFASYSPLAASVLQNPSIYASKVNINVREERPLPPPVVPQANTAHLEKNIMSILSQQAAAKSVSNSVSQGKTTTPMGSSAKKAPELDSTASTVPGDFNDPGFSMDPDYELPPHTLNDHMSGSASSPTGRQKRGRRAAIAAPSEQSKVDLPQVEKTQEELQLILNALGNSALTETYSRDVKQALAAVLTVLDYPAGRVIIKQGDPGDYFYIMKKGHCNIYKTERATSEAIVLPGNTLDFDECVQKLGPKVNEVSPGIGVGDLALLYGAPRAATVIATEDSSFWAIHGKDFRVFIRQQREAEIQRYIGFLKHVEVLKQLRENELFALAQACTPEYYKDGQAIIVQGEEGNTFYFIERGKVEVLVSGNKVAELDSNNYFGEAALLNNAPRNATCRSVGETKVAALDRESFDNLLGPLKSILEHRGS